MLTIEILTGKASKSARMRSLTLLLIIISVFAVVSSDTSKDTACSPLAGSCHVTEDCCRYLVCATYEARCVPKTGTIIPGEDKRPIGNGPFPPGYPNN